MNLAERIQRLRKSRGISQEELADQLGVSRQAVSKWESEQSAPDVEKIILLSDFFHVTTDYLLKGIEPVPEKSAEKRDARIFSLSGSVLNFIGLVAAVMLWVEMQTSSSVAVGLIFMAVGTMAFLIGQLRGENRERAASWFWIVNVWILTVIPISCLFNAFQGILFRYSWRFSPLPQLGNSVALYMLCWGFYLVICLAVDWILLKRAKR